LCGNSPRGTATRDGSAKCSEHHNVPCGSWATTYLPCCITALKSQCTKLRKLARERMVAPPVGSQPLPGWGQHARVSRGSGSQLRGTPEPPRAPWPRFLTPSSGQLRIHHMPYDSSSRHQAPGQLRDRHMPPGLQLPPLGSGQLRSYHVSRGRTQRTASY
jgi:hypothetical protein